ncbi:unnamed protein product [Pelagomonas calceolata]|uniref:Kinesin motor domain-containing protein n=1 Tax=Pelagomonas calceolata TaxID=35677 RepID=A0A8J2SE41_9STRA|nr:unnamed protein product [Pelagomonas calceolata]
MPGDVSVYVRIRPPLAGEPREAAATVLNKETVRLEVARTATVCEHGCDAAFGPHASQAELFDGVARDVVDAVLAGVDGTVVAYGQTGAGKSHTLGVLEAPDHVERARDGVVPRALRRLFAARPGEVVMSFLEIYDERVRDLLAPPRDAAEVERRRHDEAFSAKAPRPADIVEGLPVRENTRGGFEVEGLRAYAARDLAEALDLVAYGLRRRATAATKLNATSSRSHTILVVDAGGAALRVVDLAGSERNRVSGSRGVRLREARAINASLAALGNVVAALADGAAHVPFRDSVLTKLLRDALGVPGARTALVAALAPGRAAAAESASTLRFASRCARVRLRAVRRLDLAPDEQLERATRRVRELEAAAAAAPAAGDLAATACAVAAAARVAAAGGGAGAVRDAFAVARAGRRPDARRAEAALRAEALPALEALAAARAEADSWTSVLQHLVDANAALRKRLGAQDDDDDSNDDDLGEYSQLDDVSRVPVNVAME